MNLAVVGIIGVLAASSARASSVKTAYSASGPAIKQAAILSLSNGYVITPVIDSSGNLDLISWQDTGSAFKRLSTTNTGPATAVAVTPIQLDIGQTFVTAIANGSGSLELTAWVFQPTGGTMTAVGSYTSTQTATAVSLTNPFGTNMVVSGSRDVSGNLQVNAFQVNSGGLFTPYGSASAGAVSQVVVGIEDPFADGGYHVETAVKNGSGDLEMICWYLNGGAITRQGSASAGAVKAISMWYQPCCPCIGGCPVAVVNGSGNTELITWSLSSAGQFTRVGSATGPAASKLAITLAGTGVFTGSINGSGDLAGELWNTYPVMELFTDNTTVGIKTIAAALDQSSQGSRVYTVSKASNGDLQLQAWAVTL